MLAAAARAARRLLPAPDATKSMHPVDKPGLEERARKRRPAFEQERLDALGGERAQLVLERARAQLELGDPPGSGPRPNASRRGWPRGTATSRASRRRGIRPHRAHPDRDRVRRRAQLVDEPAALLARDPAAPGNDDPAVERSPPPCR